MASPRPQALARRAYRRVRSLRAAREDASFRTAIRSDPDAPALLLSPHWDDAALDCWELLAGQGELVVVNVFSGIPEPGRLTLWDEITGAEDSAARARERLAEDAVVLGRAGRAPVNLGFLDLQYRRGDTPGLGALDSAVAGAAGAASHVFAPAGIGSHPDHELARRYARMLLRAGLPVTLYAELPYCVMHGWPDWVDGRAPDPNRNVDAFWRSFLEGVPEMPELRSARVHRLDDASAAAKLDALRCYATQFSAIEYGARGLLSDPEIHRYEVSWELRAPS
jgi:LmbE family N-acetylglucosaminyl deacetylase